jgi:hypothetical protein
VLKLVLPNRFSGFRTAAAFSFAGAWYQINFAMGLALMAAGVVGGFAILLLRYGLIALKPISSAYCFRPS